VATLDLGRDVDGYSAAFSYSDFEAQPDSTAGAAQQFLNGIEARLSGDMAWGGEEVVSCARDLLEDRLMSQLHGRVFGTLEEERRSDARLAQKLLSLHGTLDHAQLDVDPKFVDTRFNRWDAAQAELRLMSARTTPRSKMDCVLRSVLQLKQGLVECLAALGKPGCFGADELFPVFVFTVAQSNPPQLHSNIAYIQRWRNPLALKSEAGCYFTHLQAAVAFLDDLASGHEAGRSGADPSRLSGGSGGGSDTQLSEMGEAVFTRQAMERRRSQAVAEQLEAFDQQLENRMTGHHQSEEALPAIERMNSV